jgi:hypothetical protein
LTTAGIAGGQRAPDRAAEDLRRVVPGHDVAGDAVRHAQRHHRAAGRVGDGLAVQLVGGAAVVLEVARAGGDVHARLLDGLAGVAAFQFGQLGVALRDERGQAGQRAPALGGRHATPGPVEGAPRGGHRVVDVAPVTARQRREGPAGGRVDHVEGQP